MYYNYVCMILSNSYNSELVQRAICLAFFIRLGRYSIVKIQQYSKNIYLTILHTEETEGNNKTVFCICLKE